MPNPALRTLVALVVALLAAVGQAPAASAQSQATTGVIRGVAAQSDAKANLPAAGSDGRHVFGNLAGEREDEPPGKFGCAARGRPKQAIAPSRG